MTGFIGPDGKILSDVSEFAKYIDYLNLMSYDVSFVFLYPPFLHVLTFSSTVATGPPLPARTLPSTPAPATPALPPPSKSGPLADSLLLRSSCSFPLTAYPLPSLYPFPPRRHSLTELRSGIPAYARSFTTGSSELKLLDLGGGLQSKLYQAKTAVVPQGDASDVSGTSMDNCGTSCSGQWQYRNMISGGVSSRSPVERLWLMGMRRSCRRMGGRE